MTNQPAITVHIKLVVLTLIFSIPLIVKTA